MAHLKASLLLEQASKNPEVKKLNKTKTLCKNIGIQYDNESEFTPVEYQGMVCSTGAILKQLGFNVERRSVTNHFGETVYITEIFNELFGLSSDECNTIFKLNDKHKTFKPVIEYLRSLGK